MDIKEKLSLIRTLKTLLKIEQANATKDEAKLMLDNEMFRGAI